MNFLSRLSSKLLKLAIVQLSLLVFSFLAAKAQVSPAVKPNIIVIMADDLDVRSLQTLIQLDKMPNLQRYLLQEGFSFQNSYVTNSLCCPSRATFLKGQYTHNHNVLTNVGPRGGILPFSDRSTLATWMQAAGYRTAHIGKYLSEYGLTDLNKNGIPAPFDIADSLYVPPGWDDWQALLDPTTLSMYGYWINDNRKIAFHGNDPASYQTDVIAQRAQRSITQARQLSPGKPFFLVVMPMAPHIEGHILLPFISPWAWSLRPAPRHIGTLSSVPFGVSPSFNEADVSDKPQWLRQRPSMIPGDGAALARKFRDRLEATRALDDLIGSIVTTLTDTGILDQTVLIFTSDNGYQLGEHRLVEKLFAYEESIRVPLLARLPGMGQPRAVPQLVLNNDLAPTILELAGAQPGLPVDGTSWLAVIRDATLPWRRRFLVEHWKGPEFSLDLPDYTAVRTGGGDIGRKNLLLVEYPDPTQTPEFYDLNTDPHQMNSLHLSTDPAYVLQMNSLRQVKTALKDCKNGSCQTWEFCIGASCPNSATAK